MQQVMPCIEESLECNNLDSGFSHLVIESLDTLSKIAHRIIITI